MLSIKNTNLFVIIKSAFGFKKILTGNLTVFYHDLKNYLASKKRLLFIFLTFKTLL